MSKPRLIDNRPLILLTLFAVTLFLGLPVLWYSRGFSRLEKLLITMLVLVWTVIVFATFGAVMWWSYVQIRDALGK